MKSSQAAITEKEEIIRINVEEVHALKESVVNYESMVKQKSEEFERLEQEKTSQIAEQTELFNQQLKQSKHLETELESAKEQSIMQQSTISKQSDLIQKIQSQLDELSE